MRAIRDRIRRRPREGESACLGCLVAVLLLAIASRSVAGDLAGALVRDGSGSANQIDFEFETTGDPVEGFAPVDAGSHLDFAFNDSTDTLTISAMHLRSATGYLILGALDVPFASDLEVVLDESSASYPPGGTVNSGTGVVELTIPFILSGEVAGVPIELRGELDFNGTFTAGAGGISTLVGDSEFSISSGPLEVSGTVALATRKFRIPLVDLNGDGSADPAIRESASASWKASYVPGEDNLNVSFGNSSDIPLVGDFNGDGISDLVVYRPGTTSQWLVSYSPDFSGSDLTINLGSSSTSDKPFVCDFNGDGLTDIGVTRTGFLGSATYVIRFSPAYAVGGEVTKAFGLASDSKFFGDINGDGACDIGVNRGGNQNYVTYSPDWGSSTDLTKSFGLAGDVPVHADYDGDGLLDFAVMRDTGSALLWYATFSSSSYSGTQISSSVGPTGGFPVVDDYNGDGRADLAAYKDGNFVIQYSPDYIGTDRTEGLGANADYKLQRPTAGDAMVAR